LIRLSLLMIAVLLAGCVDAQTKQAIQTIQDQAKITQAKADAATKAAQAAADANPAAHPQQAAENVAKGVRSWSALILVIALVACGVFLGLKFTALSAISSVGLPVSLGVLVVAFGGSVVFPFLVNPYVEIIVGLLVVGFLVFEVIRNKTAVIGIVGQLENEIKPALGIKSPAVAAVPVPPPTAPKAA
jgi:hypothetical protein